MEIVIIISCLSITITSTADIVEKRGRYLDGLEKVTSVLHLAFLFCFKLKGFLSDIN